MSKNVNKTSRWIRLYWIPFCANTKSYPGIVWIATVHNWSKWLTHIKYRFGALNTNLHFRLSRIPVVASTHLLPLRFEYLFTLRRRGTETYPIYDDPLSRLVRCGVVPLQNSSRNHCCYVWSCRFSCRRKSFPVQCEHSLNEWGNTTRIREYDV